MAKKNLGAMNKICFLKIVFAKKTLAGERFGRKIPFWGPVLTLKFGHNLTTGSKVILLWSSHRQADGHTF